MVEANKRTEVWITPEKMRRIVILTYMVMLASGVVAAAVGGEIVSVASDNHQESAVRDLDEGMDWPDGNDIGLIGIAGSGLVGTGLLFRQIIKELS